MIILFVETPRKIITAELSIRLIYSLRTLTPSLPLWKLFKCSECITASDVIHSFSQLK